MYAPMPVYAYYDVRMPSKDDVRLQSLRKRVRQAPGSPGIYRWMDASGKVLYVGKAKNLKKRLASYVTPAKKKDVGPWKQAFLQLIHDFDVTVTTTELEALLLETNLIKQLRPKYNVLMKDDKNYLFIRISVQDPYPFVETLRKIEQDGAKYFGPYMSSYDCYESLDLLQAAVGYRACRHSVNVLNTHGQEGLTKLKPCLEFQIGKCNGLCAGAIGASEYLHRIERVMKYLDGQKDEVKVILRQKMQAAATERKYELAAKIRNYLARLEGKSEQQIVADTTGEDSDIIGVAILSNRAHVIVMHRRNGRLIGESHFALTGQADSTPSVIEQFLPQFYDEGREVPDMVIIPEAPEDGGEVMMRLLRERKLQAGPRAAGVKLIVPERGRKSRLLQLAEKNAREKARQFESKWEAEEKNTKSALKELQDALSLPSLPKRIEGYDISHLGGTETVGSMVVMKNAKTANDQYRSFTIRTMKRGQVDDYKAIKEVLTRRLRRLTEDLPAEEKKWNAEGVTFGKALKKDQAAIEEIHPDTPYKECVVARHDNAIIGMGRLLTHPQNIVELTSLGTEERWRNGTLAQFIIRKILRSVKKGKVYVRIHPELEYAYGRMGFRYVITPPKSLPSPVATGEGSGVRAEKEEIVMMWEASQNKVDSSLTARPDLIVIDGGKGQLSTAIDVLRSFGVEIPVIGLAKREEEVFVPDSTYPFPPAPRSPEGVVGFPTDSPGKFLLMRLRDEAHRFSNAHREKRAKHSMTASSLDEFHGIGQETMKKLFAKFGSVSGIKEASDEQLLEIVSQAQLNSLRGT